MKPSELKQLIKEEIVSILSENQDMRGVIDEFSKEFNIPAYALQYFDYGSDGSGEFKIRSGEDFDEATVFYMDKYRELKKPNTLEDRWRSLIHVEKIN